MSRKKTARKKVKPSRKPVAGNAKPIANPEKAFAEAVQHYQSGQLPEARKRALALERQLPEQIEIKQLLGVILLAENEPAKAVEVFRKALERAPQSAELADLLGVALMEAEHLVEAVTSFRRSLMTDQRNPGTLNNLGSALKKLGQLREARDTYLLSLQYRPDHPPALSNLGSVLVDLKEYERAEEVLRRATELAPDMVEAYINLAFVQMERRTISEAIASCQKALELDSGNVSALNNLGRAYMAIGRHDEAETSIREALKVNPQHTETLQAMGIQHFLRGRWAEAWECYDQRWHIEGSRLRAFPQPLWQGEPVHGKTILVWGEQGVGDEIMFTSMVPDLLAQGANVILELDSRLVTLYQRSFPSVRCVPRQTPPVSVTGEAGIDFQISCGNLGKWLRSDEASFAGQPSFLMPDPNRILECRQRHKDKIDDQVIGISWRSANPDIGDDKSMNLMLLKPLALLPNVTLVDLQYGDTEMERAEFESETGVHIYRDPEIDATDDLDGLAAQISVMDSIVSISNTTVHMAGALGVQTNVMLPVTPLWRWMFDREDSPWYSSVSLFRQLEVGCWEPVVEKVTKEIAAVSL